MSRRDDSLVPALSRERARPAANGGIAFAIIGFACAAAGMVAGICCGTTPTQHPPTLTPPAGTPGATDTTTKAETLLADSALLTRVWSYRASGDLDDARIVNQELALGSDTIARLTTLAQAIDPEKPPYPRPGVTTQRVTDLLGTHYETAGSWALDETGMLMLQLGQIEMALPFIAHRVTPEGEAEPYLQLILGENPLFPDAGATVYVAPLPKDLVVTPYELGSNATTNR